MDLVCFGEDAAADVASAAMWQLTSVNDHECVGNPLAHERGGCRVVDPKDEGAVEGALVKNGDALAHVRGDGTPPPEVGGPPGGGLGGAGVAPRRLAPGARWWHPPVQPCVRLLKVMNEARDDDRVACLHAIASFCVPDQLWLRAADVRVGDGCKTDWWAVSTPERPSVDAQRKVVQAGGLDVITAHLVDASAPPGIRGEAARALWCLVAQNADVAAEALRGGAGLTRCVVQMLTSAPPAAKSAAAGVVGAVSALDDTLAHHLVATGCVEPVCLLLACGDVPGKCAAAEAVCTLSNGYPGEVAAGGAVAPLARIFSQGLGRAAPARAKAAIMYALSNLVRHDPKQALFLVRNGAAGPIAQFLSEDVDATKGAAASLCRATVAGGRDASDAVARAATPALVLLAGSSSTTADTRREAFLAIAAVAESSRDAAAAIIARGALQHVWTYLAGAAHSYSYSSCDDGGSSGADRGADGGSGAALRLPDLGSMGRVIWGGGGGGVATVGGFKGSGPGQARRVPGEKGDWTTYTEEENGLVAHGALVALAGLAPALDFSQQDQHGPLTPLLLRCVEVDSSVHVVEAAARAIQSMLTLGRGGDPRVALFRTGRSGGEEISTRQMLLQPLLAGLARALAAPRVVSADTAAANAADLRDCLLYTSPSPRDATLSRMPSSA